MHFKIGGPFEISLDDNCCIPDSLSEFWKRVDRRYDGLSQAKGCYVFAVKTSGRGGYYPWYVGKTNNQTFYNECFKPHQRVHYGKALNQYDKARAFLYLIPQMTKTGYFSKASSGQAIDFVETYLIGLGLRANRQLRNKKDTKLYREVILPGFLNSGRGKHGLAANELKKTFYL